MYYQFYRPDLVLELTNQIWIIRYITILEKSLQNPVVAINKLIHLLIFKKLVRIFIYLIVLKQIKNGYTAESNKN